MYIYIYIYCVCVCVCVKKIEKQINPKVMNLL